MVTGCFNFRAYGFGFDFEKSYSVRIMILA
jgi:hypothetical protein